MKQNKIYIYGKHALMEALHNRPQTISRVFLAKEVKDEKLKNLIRNAGITISPLGNTGNYEGISGGTAHQGIVGRVLLDKLMRPYKEYIDNLKITPDISLVILEELKDPQNVGAIIRSAAAFGISGVLIPKHRQAPITGAVVKVSAGMAFRVPLIEINNVGAVLNGLKKRGFRIYGLAGESKQTISKEKFDKPSVFIFGNEIRGIHQETRGICDTLLSVPIDPKCESLNVAASAAVTFYAWSSRYR